MNKKVLVTGGCGFIGSHTCVELAEAGYEPIIVDNLYNSERSVVDGIEKIIGRKVKFIEADCCDAQAMEKVFSENNFSSIIHFAAYKSVNESSVKPLEYFQNNLGSLLTLLTLMRDHNVPNIVFSSSCTVYGQADKLPVTEQTPRKEATTPYGLTKQMCEDILKNTAAAYPKMNTIALRYFNPIGAHPSALIGELPRGVPNNLIPFVTQTAAGIRECLSVFGSDYNTPDGSCIRDYIDVTDLAKAHVCAVARMIEGKSKANYEVFNVGTGTGRTTLEIVKTFEKVNNLKLNYKVVGRREGDIEAVWADPTFANKELGWKAVRPLEDTLRSAWQWQQYISRKNN